MAFRNTKTSAKYLRSKPPILTSVSKDSSKSDKAVLFLSLFLGESFSSNCIWFVWGSKILKIYVKSSTLITQLGLSCKTLFYKIIFTYF